MDDYLRMGAKIVEIWQNMEELLLSICLRYKLINVLKDSFDRLVLWYSFEMEFDVLYVWSTVHSYYIRIYTVWEIEFPSLRYNEFFFSDVALFLITVYYRLTFRSGVSRFDRETVKGLFLHQFVSDWLKILRISSLTSKQRLARIKSWQKKQLCVQKRDLISTVIKENVRFPMICHLNYHYKSFLLFCYSKWAANRWR